MEPAEPVMMRVAIIEPKTQKVYYKTVADEDISGAAGVTLDGHAVIRHKRRNFGLFTNPDGLSDRSSEPEYFSLDGRLYHGPGVLYAFDTEGRTVNITNRTHPKPSWLGSIETARSALNAGAIAWPHEWQRDE